MPQMTYIGGARVKHTESFDILTGDYVMLVHDAEYQCLECKRTSLVHRLHLTISRERVARYGKFDEFRHQANKLGQRCDCNLARCRVGAALQRKNRLLYRRKSNG